MPAIIVPIGKGHVMLPAGDVVGSESAAVDPPGPPMPFMPPPALSVDDPEGGIGCIPPAGEVPAMPGMVVEVPAMPGIVVEVPPMPVLPIPMRAMPAERAPGPSLRIAMPGIAEAADDPMPFMEDPTSFIDGVMGDCLAPVPATPIAPMPDTP
jgi:hypothetical protein